MERIERIKRVLDALGYKETSTVQFTLRRFEKVDRIHANIKGKTDEQLHEIFKMFNKRYEMKLVGESFPSTAGALTVKEMLDYLEEYDNKFSLDWCELDFKEVIIKLSYL
ncbi:MAG: hypothetical protein PHC66_00685 [Candidatus Nanoarchaeia archaeon]|nr:hypothetical protein [Candidatus Nanoarchaeia archaeon]MDD5239540.1 hypothetical protein [Candidatus Nanoarchaeia archaeon]